MASIKVILAKGINKDDTSVSFKSRDLASVGFTSPTYVVKPENESDLPLFMKAVQTSKSIALFDGGHRLTAQFAFKGAVVQDEKNPTHFKVHSTEISEEQLKKLLSSSVKTTLCTNGTVEVRLSFSCVTETFGVEDTMETVASDR